MVRVARAPPAVSAYGETMHDDADDLRFEHLGSLDLEETMLLADASMAATSFATMALAHHGASMQAQLRVSIRPGRWHVMIARGDDLRAELLLLTHEDELARETLADDLTAVTRVLVPTRRLVLGIPALAEDSELVAALPSVDPEVLPGMIRHLGVMAHTGELPLVNVSSAGPAPHASLLVPLLES